MVYQDSIRVQTKVGPSFKDITEEVKNIVKKSGIRNGIVSIFLSSTTAGLFINENESGLKADLEILLQEMIPKERRWNHNAAFGEGNAHSHLRSIFVGNSVTLPVREGNLALGTWQSILLFELDIRERERNIIVTVIGE